MDRSIDKKHLSSPIKSREKELKRKIGKHYPPPENNTENYCRKELVDGVCHIVPVYLKEDPYIRLINLH